MSKEQTIQDIEKENTILKTILKTVLVLTNSLTDGEIQNYQYK